MDCGQSVLRKGLKVKLFTDNIALCGALKQTSTFVCTTTNAVLSNATCSNLHCKHRLHSLSSYLLIFLFHTTYVYVSPTRTELVLSADLEITPTFEFHVAHSHGISEVCDLTLIY